MVRSDNVILHTLAGCSKDSVVALLDKYSQLTHYTVNIPCFQAVLWNVGSGCTLVTYVTFHKVNSFIDCMFYLYCFYYCFYF